MYKILLIDDDLPLRDTLKEILMLHDYEVLAVENGQEALDEIEKWRPHLILCDILMPVMDGLEFQEIISKDPLFSALPFIFLSAKQEENLMRNCMSLGADDFIRKPFVVEEILRTIESKIERFDKINNAHINLSKANKKHYQDEINLPIQEILALSQKLTNTQDPIENNQMELMHKAIVQAAVRLNHTMQNLFLYQDYIDNNLTFQLEATTTIVSVFQAVRAKLGIVYPNVVSRFDASVKDAVVKVEEKFLAFILYELIDNALKFSHPNTVRIRGIVKENKYYQFSIKDHGIGIQAEDLQEINFGHQFNVEKLEQHGLGLGLFMSKKIVEKFGGILNITSEKNKGTKIILYFPFVQV